MFKINCQNLSKTLNPVQKKRTDELEKLLLDIFRDRAEFMKTWLSKSIKSISGMTLKIEEFVEQKNSLDKIYKDIPIKRDELYII